MATQAGLLRAKLFGGGNASALASSATAGQHTTDQLRQATDRLAREQATAEASVSLYRHKLSDAQQAVQKLEAAYVSQITHNANLQAKVKNDYSLLSQLTVRVNQATSQHAALKLAHDQLAVQLEEAALQRCELLSAKDGQDEALADLTRKYEQSLHRVKGLQEQLDKAAQTCRTLRQDLHTARTELAGKARLQEEAEARAAQLAAELATVRGERLGLAEQLQAANADVDRMAQELSSTSTHLADLRAAKGELEAAVEAQEDELRRLAAELVDVQEASKAAQADHAAALEANRGEVQVLSTQHELELQGCLAELVAINKAKEGLEEELAQRNAAAEALKAQLAGLKEEAKGFQATQCDKLEQMQNQLQAAALQHGKEVKALKEQHQREQEAATQRTAKELESRMQEMCKVGAELQEERRRAEAAEAASTKLEKKTAELEAAKDQIEATQAAGQEQHAKDIAALQARLAQQEVEAAEERRKAAATAMAAIEQARRSAEALAAAEGKGEAAQAQADKHAAQLEQLSARVKSLDADLARLDKEHGTNLLKLDNANESLRECQDRLREAETQSWQLGGKLKASHSLLEERQGELAQAQAKIAALEKQVAHQSHMLKGISQVAANASGGDTAAAPTQEAPGRMRGGTRTGGAAPTNRSIKRVKIREPADMMATSEDEASSEEEAEEEEPMPHLALVPAGDTRRGERREPRPASQRGAQPPSRPIITEVDSGEEEEEAEAEAPPADRPPSQQRRAEAAEAHEDEERQARGRKRSGRTASGKQAGSKKARGGTTAASQGVSMEQANKRPSRGGKQATATSGHRKQMVASNAATKSKKKGAGAVGAAMNLFGNEIFGAFGGYGGGYGFDDVSP